MEALKTLVHYIINPNFLPNISWTGRGKGNERKIALSGFVHLIDFITALVTRADSKFTRQKVQKKITYAILKHAKQPAPSPPTSSTSSSSTPLDCGIPLVEELVSTNDQTHQLQQQEQPQNQKPYHQQQQKQPNQIHQNQQQVIHVQQIHSNAMKPIQHIKTMQPMQNMPFYGYSWPDNGYQYNFVSHD